MTYCLILELLRTQNSNSYKEKTTAHRGIFIKKQQTAGILTKGFQLFSCFIRAVFFQNNGTSCFPCQNTYPFFKKSPSISHFHSIFSHFTHSYTPHINVYMLFSCIIQQFYMLHIDAPPSFLALFTKPFLSKHHKTLILIGILPKICHLFSFCTTNSPNLYKYAYFY